MAEGLTEAQRAEYDALLATKPVVEPGQAPSAEQIEQLKAFKQAKKSFMAGLTPEAKGAVTKLEKAAKAATAKANKATTTKPKKTAEQKQADRAAQQAKQAEKEAEQQRKAALVDARRYKASYAHLAKWLDISMEYSEPDGEALFEVLLPKWLLQREEYLEKLDLADEACLLEPEEVREVLLEGLGELAQAYFGDDHNVEITFENMVERAQSATAVCQKGDLPAWYKHMSYPMTPEEVTASLT